MKIFSHKSIVALSTLALAASCASESAQGDSELETEFGNVGQALGLVTTIKPYLVSISPEYALQPLLSVGDRLPQTSNPAEEYQMVGIPDGMGTYRSETEGVVVMFVHELGNATLSEPIIGQPLNRGAIASKLILDEAGRVVSGDRAYDTVWDENTLVGPAADITNTTPGFARFCSASVSYRDAGFDRPILLAGEEAGGVGTFDGMGGLAVAIFDNELHTLPKFGRFPWENTLAQPKKGKQTMLIGMEDGPASPDNQLYMYLGSKERMPGATAMRRNGLDNGDMYVFVSETPGMNTELSFTSGSINGHWSKIESPETMTDVQLEAASDALSAFGFIRTEDGAFDVNNPDVFYFVSTGSATGNQLGRLYKMTLDATNPLVNTTIELIYNADELAAVGVDSAISPDNLGVNEAFLMINEDGTTPSRTKMESLGREGSIWRYDLLGFAGTRIAELNPPARDAIDVPTSGTWESTGIVPIKGLGRETWLVNVQAHGPSTAPAPNTVEDGQLLLLRRTQFDTLATSL
jgi:hypothetical protein